jgi:hypothetical protein
MGPAQTLDVQIPEFRLLDSLRQQPPTKWLSRRLEIPAVGVATRRRENDSAIATMGASTSPGPARQSGS